MTQRERNIRAAIAWRLFEVGDAATRLAHKVCDEIPTIGDHSKEFDAGRWVGQRERARQATALFVEATR